MRPVTAPRSRTAVWTSQSAMGEKRLQISAQASPRHSANSSGLVLGCIEANWRSPNQFDDDDLRHKKALMTDSTNESLRQELGNSTPKKYVNKKAVKSDALRSIIRKPTKMYGKKSWRQVLGNPPLKKNVKEWILFQKKKWNFQRKHLNDLRRVKTLMSHGTVEKKVRFDLIGNLFQKKKEKLLELILTQ